MQLLLVRHAETQWNVERRIQGWTNSSLTTYGTQQAQALADRLNTTRIDAIYSSDSRRAVLTAECVSFFQKCDVIPMESLRETSWGEWEGMTGEEIADMYPDLWLQFVERGNEKGHIEDWETTTIVPGGETMRQVSKRIAASLRHLNSVHPYDENTILVVGHGGSLRYFFTEALGISPALARRFHLDNTSVSEIFFSTDHPPIIRGLNDTWHLNNI